MDAKLNHSDLSSLLAKEAGITMAKADSFTKAMFDLVIEGLEQDGIVKINGLGTFKLTDVASRSSVNVNTGEKFEIKGHKKLTFTPADTLKDNVNQPFAMFEPVEVDETYSDDEDISENDDLAVDENEPADTASQEKENTEVEETVAETKEEAVAEVEEPKEEDATETEEPKEEVMQPRPVEPVMVHVPKKEKKTVAVPEKKRSYKWLYITLSLLLVIATLYALYITPKDTAAVAENETVVVEQPTDAVTAATVDATSGATPQEQELVATEEPLEVLVAEKEEPEEYKFVMTEELASLDLKDITLADTVMYAIGGEHAEHKVVANETLTRIALQYYGDKKLWPYIVKYNSLARPDALRKGMTIKIPELRPRK